MWRKIKFFCFLFLIYPNIYAAEKSAAVTICNLPEKSSAYSSVTSTSIVPGSPICAYKFLLKNGLTVIVVPDNRNPVATIHFILDAGSNREKKGTTGLAHFFEHMMFRKTMNAPEGNYDRVLNSVGGTGNAGTSDAFVTFYSVFPAPALETMLKLEADRFMHLDITEPFFSTEKEAVNSERKLRVENDPIQSSTEVIRAMTEQDTPMEWMTIGTKKDVQNMQIETAKKFYQDYYTPDNTTMVIGGPFEFNSVMQLVDKYFAAWQGTAQGSHPSLPKDYFIRNNNKLFICSSPTLTKHYQIIYPSPNADLKSVIFSYIFQAVLDDNSQGSFIRRLTKEKLATNFSFVKAYWQDQNNPLIVTLDLLEEQKFDTVQSFWQMAVNEVLKKPLTEKIKKQVIKQLSVSNAETAERMTSLVSTIIDSSFFLNNFDASGQAEKIVQNATTDSFRKWILDNLDPNKSYVTGIVTERDAPPCIKK